MSESIPWAAIIWCSFIFSVCLCSCYYIPKWSLSSKINQTI